MLTPNCEPGTVVIIDKPNVQYFHNKIGIVMEYIKAFNYDAVTPNGLSVEKRHYFSVALTTGTHVFPHDELKVL